MSKIESEQGSRQAIFEAIRKIALHGVVNPKTGAAHYTGKVTGYVAAIHTEGELAGTIDVQEYLDLSDDEDEDVGVGFHEGVLLSAIQNNSTGMVIVPKLYSEVTITTDPETMNEYVIMFSHVDIIQMDSHEKVVVGVTEREEYDIDDDDAPDVENLEPTGLSAHTTYLKDSITDEVIDKEGDKQAKQTITSSQIKNEVGKESGTLIDEDKVKLKHGSSEATLDDNSVTIKHGGSSVVVEDGVVSVGSKSGTSSAVLYEELAQIFGSLLDYIAQIKTTTQLGPQPPLNVPAFLSLKGQIERFKSTHVKIQK